MMAIVHRILQRVLDAVIPSEPRRSFRTVNVDDVPRVVVPGTLYIAGENGHTWFASMRCPCGCKATIQLNLLPDTRPCWTLSTQKDGRVSLSPSVWRKIGCRSHFFVRRGRVEWCGRSGP